MKATLIQDQTWEKEWKYIPIEIQSIDENKLFPVRFKYTEEGYSDLVFSASLSDVIFEKEGNHDKVH